jgi:hypothetical protein
MRLSSFLTLVTGFAAFLSCASAQVNNSGQKPYLGWSSFSQQTIDGNFLTQANMIVQSDALKASVLEEHGFVYLNLDSGWQGIQSEDFGPCWHSGHEKPSPPFPTLSNHFANLKLTNCRVVGLGAAENFT